MREIACPSCKYGVTEVVASEADWRRLNITRRCMTCGAQMQTYTCDDGGTVIGNMPPPKPPPQVESIGPLRNEQGELLDLWPA